MKQKCCLVVVNMFPHWKLKARHVEGHMLPCGIAPSGRRMSTEEAKFQPSIPDGQRSSS